MSANVGLCTIANKDAPVDAVLDVAAGAGYDGVEVWGRDHVGDRSADRLRAVREAAAERGLKIPVYGSYLRAGSESFEGELDRELAVADRLGGDLIRVWAGEDDYADRDPDEWESAVADLATAADAAAEYGLGVVVERHRGSFTDETAGARALIEAVDRENCRLNWQPNFSNPAEAVVASARELAPISDNVHVQAFPEPDGSARCPLADAYFDLGAVIEAFRSAGFDGYFEVEFVADGPFEERIREDREFLSSLL